MGRIAVHEFSSLDGVVETPSWTAPYGFTAEMGAAISSLMGEALLMGRRTYEMFYPAWSTRSAEEDPGAPFMNESPKHVVSSTLTDPEWNNTTVLGSYDPAAIRDLKERTENLYVSGSVQLVRAMLADGLVDELHLFIYPLVLGAGLRLFAEGEQVSLSLSGCESFANGVAHLTYTPPS